MEEILSQLIVLSFENFSILGVVGDADCPHPRLSYDMILEET